MFTAPVFHKGVADFTWPRPLPPCGPDAPPLNKGLIVGTWPPDPEQGFDREWLDEVGLREVSARDLVARRAWTGFTAGDATVRVDDLLKDRDGPAIGYVFSLFTRALGTDFSDQPAVLHVRHRGRVRAWWDGRLVLDARAVPGESWAGDHVPIVLTGPYDVLLIKIGRGSDNLGPSMDLTVAVSAPDGSAVPSQKWQSMRLPGLPSDLDPER